MNEAGTRKPCADSLRIVKICHEQPKSGVADFVNLSGMDKDRVYHLVQNLRKNRNIATASRPDGKADNGRYIATPKGRANIGVQPKHLEPEIVQPKHYKVLTPIVMTSHRPGAWDANAIKRRGLPC